MPILLFVFAIIVATATPVFAQTHPCDATPTASTVSGAGNAPLILSFCAKPSDDIVRIEVIVDNAPLIPFAETEAIEETPPNADGYSQFKVSIGTRAAGSHTVRVQVVNLGDDGQEQTSDVSDSLSFTVTAPKAKPAKPRVTGVSK